MRAFLALAAWVVLSLPIGVLVGRWLARRA
jgi:uncharacterized protein YneF (UPF0154 family)